MATLSPSILLDTWDVGAQRHPVDRALLLLLSLAGYDAEAVADVPLGRRNREIMNLRRAGFGERLSVWVDCAACGERMSLELAIGDLPEAGTGAAEVEVGGHRFRTPTSRDVAALAGAGDAEAAARALFRACAVAPNDLPGGPALDALIPAVEAALEAADPWTDLTLAAACPACGETQEVALDVPGLVWDEIAAVAARLVDEVHTLASAYGWAERDILAMSDTRRAGYLERVGA